MTYLTIREFGSLRGISVGSLRYYEKLGLLKPARIDPDTGYRYYLPEQIVTLDVIQMCVALDIPLKELNQYVDEEGHLDLGRILIRGRKVLLEKMEQMNTTLKMTEYGLDLMHSNEEYRDRKECYTREIDERWFYVIPSSGDRKKLAAEQRHLFQSFRDLQRKNMAPFFPSGIMLRLDGENMKMAYFLRVLRPDIEDESVIRIPQGTYRCLQKNMTDRTDIRKVIEENFTGYEGQTIIITNMMTGKLHYPSRLSEIQLLDGSGIPLP
jgi:DNA-binding transcriptional MerR regulator